jgi:hypothetical protein
LPVSALLVEPPDGLLLDPAPGLVVPVLEVVELGVGVGVGLGVGVGVAVGVGLGGLDICDGDVDGEVAGGRIVDGPVLGLPEPPGVAQLVPLLDPPARPDGEPCPTPELDCPRPEPFPEDPGGLLWPVRDDPVSAPVGEITWDMPAAM